jgi:hypothetical protein
MLFLFCVNRYRRLPSRLKRVDPRIDVFKLSVAVGVTGALAGLAVRLQAEPQQPPDQLLTDGKAKFGRRTGKMPLTLAHPQ